MKNTISLKTIFRIVGFIAIVAVIGLSMIACGEPGGGGGGSITNGDIAKDAPVNVGTINTSTEIVFDKCGSSSYPDPDHIYTITDKVPGTSITVKNGKLNMKLGTPISSALQSYTSGSGLTVNPPDAQVYVDFTVGPFWSSDGKYMLYCGGPNNSQAAPIYVNKDATASGTMETNTINMSLKTGWNYMIFESTITASQTLPSGYSWKIEENK